MHGRTDVRKDGRIDKKLRKKVQNSQRPFPFFFFTDEKKLDEVFSETEKSRQMLSQILLKTINTQSYDKPLRGTEPQVKNNMLLHMYWSHTSQSATMTHVQFAVNENV